MRFMKSHKCYDIVPTSSKLVVFDTALQVLLLSFLPLFDTQGRFPHAQVNCWLNEASGLDEYSSGG